MNDYISREDVVFQIERLLNVCGNDKMELALNWAKALVNKIPAADVRPVVRGEWYDGNRYEVAQKVKLDCDGNVTDTAFCSVCGDWLTASDEYAVRGRFCPNCGADMRGEESNGET